jgi:hypothetical protein
MFEVGDRIIRVEHGGSRFRLISWRVWRNSGLKWQFQQESTDEQCFFIFPSSLEPLIPIAEGEDCCILFLLLLNSCKMTSPQGMDELFWGRDYEDVNDWAERLTMAAEVRDLNADKLFKIAKLNLRGRAKEWFKKLQPMLADWNEMRTLIVQKYGNVDVDDI